MTIAKALTSGELPVGGVVATKEMAEAFDNTEGSDGQLHHGVGGRIARACYAAKLYIAVGVDDILNRRGRDILAFTRFK